jgi:hypothetical protein
MLKTLAAAGLFAALAGCAVAPGYDYGYAQPAYYGYGPAYEPAYGTVNIGIWGGGSDRFHGDRDHFRGRDHFGDRDRWGGHGPGREGGHGGSWSGGGRGGPGGHSGHGGGGHGGR